MRWSARGEGREGRRLPEQVREAASAGASAEADRLIGMLLTHEEQVVAFCRYPATLAELSGRLAPVGVSRVLDHGGLPRIEKDAAIEAFRDGKRLLPSAESGGEGRNIQFCRTRIAYDLPWDPMVIEQRVGRLHCIGRHRDVFVFDLALAGTLEEELLPIPDEKNHLFETVMGRWTRSSPSRAIRGVRGHRPRPSDGSRHEIETRRRFEEFGRELEAAHRSYESEKALDEAAFSGGLRV